MSTDTALEVLGELRLGAEETGLSLRRCLERGVLVYRRGRPGVSGGGELEESLRRCKGRRLSAHLLGRPHNLDQFLGRPVKGDGELHDPSELTDVADDRPRGSRLGRRVGRGRRSAGRL